jgi:hypothetical protein
LCENTNKELLICDSEFDNTPSNFLGSKKNNGEFYGLVVTPEVLPPQLAELIDSLNVTLKAKPKQKKIDVTVNESKIWSSNASTEFLSQLEKLDVKKYFSASATMRLFTML